MKTLSILAILAASTMAQASVLNCATAMGGYNEVEKFQIYEMEAVGIGGRILKSECLQSGQSLECTFKNKSMRSYSVLLDLKSLTGVIDQALRQSHDVSCTLEK